MTLLRYTFLPRSLFGRSLMIIALPVLLLQMIVAFVFFDRHWDSMSERLVFALSGEIAVVTKQLETAPTEAAVKQLTSEIRRSLGVTVTVEKFDPQAVSKSKRLFQKIYLFALGKKFETALQKQLAPRSFSISSSDKEDWFQVLVQIDDNRMARFLCPERRLTSSTTYIFILWLIGSAVILFGIAILFMRNQVRPIMRLAVAAEKLGKGQDVPDFKPVGASEVRRAAIAFMQMKDRLKRQIEQRTAMLSGVSHDLRTPLTRMKLQLAMMKDSPGLQDLRADVDEMEKMVEGYLAFAKGEGDETPEITDLSVAVARIISNARRQGFTIHDDIAAPRTIKVRPVAIERAIANIVSNACNYAPEVWVRAQMHDQALEIAVDDNGPGIPAEVREDVFKPFHRLEKSRNKKTGGLGLGLTIARDIVHGHGGEISLETSDKGGLSVRILLPV